MRLTVAAAIAGGVAMALVEMIMAMSRAERWPVTGLITILAADVTAALVLGALAGGLLAVLTTPDRLAALVRAILGLFRPRDPATEAIRLARALGGAVAVGVAALALHRLDRAAIERVAADTDAWLAASTTAAVALAVAALLGALVRTVAAPLLERVCRRAGRLLSLPVVFAVVTIAVLAVALVSATRLEHLAAAFDLRPFALAAVLGAATVAALGFALCHPRGAALAARLTRPVGWLALVIVLGASWLVGFGPASDDRAAVRLYRREAPISGLLVGGLARLLDRDGDGYSPYFGDGDCAPTDSNRHPSAPDRAGDGIDQDCFDGDLDPAALLVPPPTSGSRPSLPARMSFVVIFIDTLRPDHLGTYGHVNATSPNIDQLAAQSIVFEHAYSASTFTSASLAGFNTARPPGHAGDGILRRSTGDIPPDLPTFLEAFGAAGYQTAVVTDLASAAPPAFRGVDIQRGVKQRPREVVPAALKVLDKFGADPFVLVVYFAGPHAPYRQAEDAPDFGDDMPALYDSAIAFTDSLLAPLFAVLDEPRYRDRVALTLVSDHGEAFGEHGAHYHGHNVYDETTRIPMIVRVPGLAPRRLGAAPVSLLDVVPTLLGLAGLPPLPDAVGHDLTDILATGVENLDRRVFVEAGYPAEGYQAAVVSSRYKLMLEESSRTLLLFDLDADPGEHHDLAGALPDVFTDLRRTLAVFRSQARP